MNRSIISFRCFLLACLMLSLAACTDFQVSNDNPDVASNIDNNPELLLTNLIREPINQMVGAAWSEGNLQAQYSARIVFTSFDQFEWGSQSGHWNQLYLSIRDAMVLRQSALANQNVSYEAVALIMQSWMFQILTDMWGDIPYKEALKGRAEEPVYAPAYDAQEDIYMDLLDKLGTANTLLSGTNLPQVRGDILFDGDLDRWRQFANSLRLRVALRLSKVQPATAEQHIAQIYGNPEQYPVFTSNAEHATLRYLGNYPNAHPISEESRYRSGSFNEYRMSETVEAVLRGFNDPRMMTWFAPTANSVANGDPEWDGMKNGLVDGTAYVYKGGDAFLSKWADMFFFEANAIEGMLLLYPEVEFIFAEAAMRDWIDGDAEAHYEAGIAASFDYWNTDMPANYLQRDGVAYDGSLETIMNQKYLALIYQDFQGFIEYKRTGYPTTIQPGPDAFLPDYPSRFLYPQEEQSLNAANREAAISRQGPDLISTPVWWEGS